MEVVHRSCHNDFHSIGRIKSETIGLWIWMRLTIRITKWHFPLKIFIVFCVSLSAECRVVDEWYKWHIIWIIPNTNIPVRRGTYLVWSAGIKRNCALHSNNRKHHSLWFTLRGIINLCKSLIFAVGNRGYSSKTSWKCAYTIHDIVPKVRRVVRQNSAERIQSLKAVFLFPVIKVNPRVFIDSFD